MKPTLSNNVQNVMRCVCLAALANYLSEGDDAASLSS